MKRLFTTAVLGAAVLFAVATEAAAGIVVFTNGRTMKVSGYQAKDDQIELTLQSGGTMMVALSRVQNVLDDEVVPEKVVEEVREVGQFPTRVWGYDSRRPPLFASRYDALIVEAAKKFDVDAALVSAVIKAESDYNPRVVSHKGARGLMQLMPATAARFGVKDSFDPSANIHGGTRYLRWLLDKFEGNADLAVAAYNAGEGNIKKYNGIPPFRETINYVKKISRHFREKLPQPTATNASR